VKYFNFNKKQTFAYLITRPRFWYKLYWRDRTNSVILHIVCVTFQIIREVKNWKSGDRLTQLAHYVIISRRRLLQEVRNTPKNAFWGWRLSFTHKQGSDRFFKSRLNRQVFFIKPAGLLMDKTLRFFATKSENTRFLKIKYGLHFSFFEKQCKKEV